MRLRVHSNKKVKTTEKQKRINSEKKAKGPKISKNYRDVSIPVASENGEVKADLTQLTYGMIDNCDLISVYTEDGTIELTGSWIELIISMMDTIISDNPDKFREIFMENEVTSPEMNVDSTYGKYVFDSREQYKVYSIYNSGYYLEAIFNNSNIFSAIVGLTKALRIPLNLIKFNMVLKGADLSKLGTDIIEDTSRQVDVDDINIVARNGVFLRKVSILGIDVDVRRLDVALFIVLKIISKVYGDTLFDDLQTVGNTGICKESDCIEDKYEKIDNTDYVVYTDGNVNDITDMLIQIRNALALDSDQFNFTIMTLKKKSELKEYEVD